MGIVVAYGVLVVAAVADQYNLERTASTDEIVDGTLLVYVLAILAFGVGVLVGRWWAIVPPLLALIAAGGLAIVGGLSGGSAWDGVDFALLLACYGGVASLLGVLVGKRTVALSH